MYIVAQPGSMDQKVIESLDEIPDGYVVMVEPCPVGRYKARTDGTWQKIAQSVEHLRHLRREAYTQFVDPLMLEALYKYFSLHGGLDTELLLKIKNKRTAIQTELVYESPNEEPA